MKKLRFLIYIITIVLSYLYLYPEYNNIYVIFLPAIVLELIYSFFNFQKKLIEIIILGLLFVGGVTYVKLDKDSKKELHQKAECMIKCDTKELDKVENNKCFCKDGTVVEITVTK